MHVLFQSAQHIYEKREGSGAGSVSLPNGSRSGPGRPKNMLILWIRFRIPNTEIMMFQNKRRICVFPSKRQCEVLTSCRGGKNCYFLLKTRIFQSKTLKISQSTVRILELRFLNHRTVAMHKVALKAISYPESGLLMPNLKPYYALYHTKSTPIKQACSSRLYQT